MASFDCDYISDRAHIGSQIFRRFVFAIDLAIPCGNMYCIHLWTIIHNFLNMSLKSYLFCLNYGNVIIHLVVIWGNCFGKGIPQ